MKKSEIYKIAMISIADDDRLDAATRVKIIAALYRDKELAEICEKQEVEKEW